jgi:ketosteroid isomerase-like protein
MNARYQGSDLTGLTLAAIVLAMVALALVPGSGQSAQQSPPPAPTPRAVFGSLISHYCRLWNAAAQADNPAKAAPLYAKDAGLVFYGLGESEYRGWGAYGNGMKSELFDNALSLEFSPGGQLTVTKKDGVAWTSAILHVSIIWSDGRDQEFDAEQTAVWEKRDGEWLIVHEHLSSPTLRPEAVGS